MTNEHQNVETESSSKKESNSDFRPQLDTLRCLAIAIVILYHIKVTDVTGLHGVWLFFAISGFVITRRLLLGSTGKLAHDLRVFYARRALRILPIYYLFLTVMLLFGLLPQAPWYYGFLVNVLFARDGHWGVPDTGVGVAWSLSVEEQFYLLYPLFLLCTPVKWRGRMLLLLIALSIAARIILLPIISNGFADLLLPVVGQYLLWGGLAAWLDLKPESKKISPALCIVVGAQLVTLYFFCKQEPLASAVWTAACYLKIERLVPTLLWTLNAVGNAMIVFGVWRLQNPLWLRLFTIPVLVYIGKISYCLYLIHVVCLYLLRDHLRLPYSEITVGWLSLALSISLASLSWFFFEKPINSMKVKFPYKQA